MLVGIDEVGRGPVAGPVVLCGVAFPASFPDTLTSRLNDSKKLSRKRRETLSASMMENGVIHVLSEKTAQEVDTLGISECIRQCSINITKEFIRMYGVMERIHFIMDGNINYLSTINSQTITSENLIRGDGLVPQIMGASIIAKVYRDDLMVEFSKIHPHYDLENNKGYGSARHMNAIREHGITPIHRKSFLKNIIGNP